LKSTHLAFLNFFRARRISISNSFMSFTRLAKRGMSSVAALLKLL